MAYPPPPGGQPPAEGRLREFFLDLGARKEFRALRLRPPTGEEAVAAAAALCLPAYGVAAPSAEEAGLHFHGAQLFARNYQSPDTPYPRLLLNWQTGTGKTIGALAVAREFIRQFRAQGGAPAQRPTVYVVGFTRTIIQDELLAHPEFGYVSSEEVAELVRLRAAVAGGGTAAAARALATRTATYKRRLTDRARGGYFQFFGYKEFANRLFTVTRRGAAGGFSVQGLYLRRDERRPQEEAAAASSSSEEEGEGALLGSQDFLARIEEAVAGGLVRVNAELLGALRGGLLVADEVHNTYNVRWKNHYGVALQYALDALEEASAPPPRVLLMTATVTGGSPTEVVDLLNLLLPLSELPGRRRLRREDFFEIADVAGKREARPRPGALDALGRYSAGRVSFLLEAGEGGGDYPRRVLEGAPLPDPFGAAGDIPYLRFTPCPMAPYHARTLARVVADSAPGARVAVPVGAYALYDLAFPNPEYPPRAAADDPAALGLYTTAEVTRRLTAAPQAWRDAAGVAIETARLRAGGVLIGGAFLAAEPGPGAPPGVAAYSAKYARLVQDLVAHVRGGPGKALVYHHRVRMSGVRLLQELLRANGFADDTEPPTPATLCAVCGRPRRDHAGGGPSHTYTPARFLAVTSDLDRGEIEAQLGRYNAPTNLEGYQYRVLLGSKVLREGWNLRAVRLQAIAAAPSDIPALLQVLGRAVRKGSHAELPPEAREVRVRMYVSTAAAPGAAAPEVERYAEKVRAYLTIQEVERALRAYAVDAGFAARGASAAASLEAIPYRPAVTAAELRSGPTVETTFLAYGHGLREVATLAAAIRGLFGARPVWTYADLWAAVRTPGAVPGLGQEPSGFSEERFAAALGALAAPHPPGFSAARGDPSAGQVVRAGGYYLWAPAGPGGRPQLDVEAYARGAEALAPLSVPVAAYAASARTADVLSARVAEFEKLYAEPLRPIEGLLADYGAEFHEELLRRLVEARAAGAALAPALGRAEGLYRRFRVLVLGSDLARSPAALAAVRGPPPGAREVAGYLSRESVRLFGGGGWYGLPRASLEIGPRFREEPPVVGFFEARAGKLRFKLRPALGSRAPALDGRLLEKGAACATRPRPELVALAGQLRAAPRGEVAAMGVGQLCLAIRGALLEREAAARSAPRAMADAPRHFYLWNDPLPPLRSALAAEN